MSLIESAARRHFLDVRARLQNPPNAHVDFGIDLRRYPQPAPKLLIEPTPMPEPSPPAPEPVPVPEPVTEPAPVPAPDPVVALPPRTYPAVINIQKAVCRRYRVTLIDLHSARRTSSVVRPRQIAMYLAKTLTPRSLPDIGRRFGGRDHTTVLHAVRKIEAMRAADLEFADELTELEQEIEQSLQATAKEAP